MVYRQLIYTIHMHACTTLYTRVFLHQQNSTNFERNMVWYAIIVSNFASSFEDRIDTDILYQQISKIKYISIMVASSDGLSRLLLFQQIHIPPDGDLVNVYKRSYRTSNTIYSGKLS